MILPIVKSKRPMLNKPIISLFNCDPTTIDRNPYLLPIFHKYDLRTSFECYLTPQHQDFDKYREEWTKLIYKNIYWCKLHHLRAVVMGDDIMRGPAQREVYWNNPIVPNTLKFVSEEVAPISDGIEVVDEIGQLPSEYRPELFRECWKGCPVAFPGFAQSKWWPWSDYASSQWRWFVSKNWKQRAQMLMASLSGIPDRFELSAELIGIEEFYHKRALSVEPIIPPLKPQELVAQFYIGMAKLASRFRVYAYDWELWQLHRTFGPTNSMQQTGFRHENKMWKAFMYMLDSCRWELFEQTPYEPILSTNFLTGRRGNTFIVVNILNQPRKHPKAKQPIPPAGVLLWEVGQTWGTPIHWGLANASI